MSSGLGYQTMGEYIDHGHAILRNNGRRLSTAQIRNVYDYVARDVAPHFPPTVVRELLYLLRFTIGYGREYFDQGVHRSSRGKPGIPRLNAPANGASPRTTQRTRAVIVQNGWFDCESSGRGGGYANVYRPSQAFLQAATAKRDDVVYGNTDTLIVVKEYERLIDRGANLTGAQFACALWCVYAIRSTVTYSDSVNGRFASWAALARGKWSRQRRLIFPAINLGRTAMKEGFRALETAGYIRVTHRAHRPCLFTMLTWDGALESIRRAGAANDADTRLEPAPGDSRTETAFHRLEYSRPLHELRRERPTVWLRRVWQAAVELRDRERLEHVLLTDTDAREAADGLLWTLELHGIRSELDQRRFLLIAANSSPSSQWYQIGHLNSLSILNPLLSQFLEGETKDAA